MKVMKKVKREKVNRGESLGRGSPALGMGKPTLQKKSGTKSVKEKIEKLKSTSEQVVLHRENNYVKR